MTSEQSAPIDHPNPTALDEATVLGRNKRILLAALKQGGASTATVTYAGSGDSGSVESVTFETSPDSDFDGALPIAVFADQGVYQDGAWHTPLVEQQVSIEQALGDFAEEALELLHGGWENSDGASGSVIFDCQDGTVRIEHTAYYTDSEYEETTL
jgi:hypothetical protein